MQPWAAGVAFSLNIPSIKFCVTSIAMCCYFGHFLLKTEVEFPFSALYLKDHERDITRPYDVEVKEELGENRAIMLVNSSRAIDGKYIEYLSEIGKTEILPTGVVVQDIAINDEEMEIVKWLGNKKENSTVYVSFGSENFLTKEEMEEVAYGLEVSNVHFVWVVRFPKEEQVVNLEDVLPQGFLQRNIGEKGRIIERWAPQTIILKHPKFGVPIIALPMNFYSDQPLNARLIVENGVGVEMARDGYGKIHRGNVAETIKDVIFGGRNIGEDLRRKVKDLRENIKLQRWMELLTC
nr:beta-D-glucosyl crocetin beta-1,6-glucosyltransferase-like [Solanum lycopersicum]